MAADIVPTPDYLNLALALLGFSCTFICTLIGLLVRMVLNRAASQHIQLATDLKGLAANHAELEKEFIEYRVWTRYILNLAGIITSSGESTGRRY